MWCKSCSNHYYKYKGMNQEHLRDRAGQIGRNLGVEYRIPEGHPVMDGKMISFFSDNKTTFPMHINTEWLQSLVIFRRLSFR